MKVHLNHWLIGMFFAVTAAQMGGAELHWAYAPLSQSEVPPAVEDASIERARNPIDLFVFKGLEDRGMTMSDEADRRVLIRRLYMDLTGLPPSLEETQRFVAATDPRGYEAMVDRLLASPRYGERWARHWMDLVHFAESHGHDQDRPRENAWPYRDYLIRSFNSDKPYARFVKEQLAGDVLFPQDPWATVATGFMAAGPWDESSLRDIREDSIDREIARYIDRDDIVTTTMSTFASTTVHCARCHDHKFDPVSIEDYYNLQAVFAATDKADRPYDPEPGVAERRRELKRNLEALPGLVKGKDAALMEADVSNEVLAWEKRVGKERWHIVTPVTYGAAEGSTLTLQDDLSLLASGGPPERETYTVEWDSDLEKVSGVRVEVLTDSSLPQNGPGRAGNGNLHLNEVKLRCRNAAGVWEEVPIESARADFDQEGWIAAMSIDGKDGTAWGIHPEVGKSHWIAFKLASPKGKQDGTRFQLELRQIHGGSHLIGKPRFSATDALNPTHISDAPVSIADILEVDASERTDEQRVELAGFVLKSRWMDELAGLPSVSYVYSGNNRFKADGTFRPTAEPRAVNVLARGKITRPKGEANAAGLNCLPELSGVFEMEQKAGEGGRRAGLARWLTAENNSLVWRSIVNRVWQYHFGRGLVDTPNDFGQMGSEPTHPELLDWLALQFRDSGGSFKRLHRLIVTSATYRQRSDYASANAQIDAANRYLWRMNRRRLDAESYRDSVLQIVGALDLRMGGKSVKQFVQKPGAHVTPALDYINFDVDSPANYRRSVYRFVFRTVPDPLMEVLDFPDASLLTPQRTESLTALQSLALMNNKWIVRQSKRLAEQIENSTTDPVEELQSLFRAVHCRDPNPFELEQVGKYRSSHGLANTVRYVFNSNEFMFID